MLRFVIRFWFQSTPLPALNISPCAFFASVPGMRRILGVTVLKRYQKSRARRQQAQGDPKPIHCQNLGGGWGRRTSKWQLRTPKTPGENRENVPHSKSTRPCALAAKPESFVPESLHVESGSRPDCGISMYSASATMHSSRSTATLYGSERSSLIKMVIGIWIFLGGVCDLRG